MEYEIGPVLALLISMKFTDWKIKEGKPKVSHDEILDKITLVEQKMVDQDKQMSQKVLTTMMPLAKAVTKLNQEVGL